MNGIDYSMVPTGELFAGGFEIRPGRIQAGKKEFSFRNKATGVCTTRWVSLDRLGKSTAEVEQEKERKKRHTQNLAARASANRERHKKR
jgi:hypothetical protein